MALYRQMTDADQFSNAPLPLRLFPSEHAATTIAMGKLAFGRDHLLDGPARSITFHEASLGIESSDCIGLLRLAELCLRHSRLHDPDRLVIDLDRHREGVAILSTVSEGETGGVTEPV